MEEIKIKMKMKIKKVKVLVKSSIEKYDAATPNLGIGAQARECIKAGYNFQQTLEFIKQRVTHTGFSKRCFYWYRNDMRKKNLLPAYKAPTKKAA